VDDRSRNRATGAEVLRTAVRKGRSPYACEVSFSLSVSRVADLELFDNPPEDVASPEFDAWFEECQRRTLFSAPLAGDGGFYTYWHEPATRLGLPLVGAIYNSGLRVLGEQLGNLARETEQLRHDWLRWVPDDAWSDIALFDRQLRIPMLVDLFNRSDDLDHAIQLAERIDGTVDIS